MRYTDEDCDWSQLDGQRMVGAATDYARRMGIDPKTVEDTAMDDRSDHTHLIYAALDRLATGDRALLEAHYCEGATVAELAGDLGISQATARKRLERARGRLRAEMVFRGR